MSRLNSHISCNSTRKFCRFGLRLLSMHIISESLQQSDSICGFLERLRYRIIYTEMLVLFTSLASTLAQGKWDAPVARPAFNPVTDYDLALRPLINVSIFFPVLQ